MNELIELANKLNYQVQYLPGDTNPIVLVHNETKDKRRFQSIDQAKGIILNDLGKAHCQYCWNIVSEELLENGLCPNCYHNGINAV